ncbi:MAG: AMP-dependent synthetase/ligase [Thermodesulfobacteriota bacterium]
MKLNHPTNKLPLLRDKKGISTIPEMFEKKTAKYGKLSAFFHIKDKEIREYSYSDIFDYVIKISEHLKNLGIGKGDHVAIIGENRPEWAISYFAVSWIGAVSIPLDSKANTETLKYILDYSDSKAVFLPANYLDKLRIEFEQKIDSKNLIVMDSFDEIKESIPTGSDKEHVDPDDINEILFTSGTTGNPKGVMLSNRNIMSNVEDVYSFLDINPGDRAFSILPIHHSYEKTGGLLSTFYSGISIYYGRGLKPRDLLQDLLTVKPTIWINTPLLLEKLITRINKELAGQKGLKKLATKLLPKSIINKKIKKQLGLEELRLLVSGGAALPDWVFDGFRELGITIIEGYGMSEASPIISANPVNKAKKGSVGMVIQSDEVEIREPDNENNGEIVIKGPNVMHGYYKNPDATYEVLSSDGWLRTGDIGYFDEDGYLYITGRKKFIIVTPGGKNIFPEEIEEKLTKLPIIEEALVFSPDDKEIQAIIYPNIEEYCYESGDENEDIKNTNLYKMLDQKIKDLNRDLEPYKRVSKFAIKKDEFPKTTTRKIKRYLFKDIDLNSSETYL